MDKKNNGVSSHVLKHLEDKTQKFSDRVALGIKTQYAWKEFTYKGIGLLSRKIANYLINNLNLQKGDHVAMLSESKPEFGACLFASVLAGTTFVPLDVKLTKYELRSILSDCKPSLIFVSHTYFETVLQLKAELDFIKYVILIDELPFDTGYKTIYSLENNYNGKWRRSSLKSTVFLIYTSGTTGSPKGVEISYLNMLTQLRALENVKYKFFPNFDNEDISILSILPMNHLFELTVGFCTFMNWGLSVYYTQSLRPNDILSVMREKNIKFMIVVPAFLKLLKSSIEAKINSSSPLNKLLFKAMFNISAFIPFYSIRKLLFKKIHDSFGGNFCGCISGGAPLDISVGKFFERIGIKVYHGYGLSETSPVVCVNCEKRHKLESVGKPFDCFETKINKKTGEILFRGTSVMKGYYNNEKLTNEVIDKDGWLHTGDIGKLDKDGYLYITGRIKNMIVLSGGKKVFPEEIEAVLEKSDKFQEVCVFGYSKNSGEKSGTEDIAVVVVPKEEYKTRDDLDKIMQDEVKLLSAQLAAYKRPIKIFVENKPLPRTTTRKVKRNEIKELLKV